MGLQWLHITCFLLLLQLSFEATSQQIGRLTLLEPGDRWSFLGYLPTIEAEHHRPNERRVISGSGKRGIIFPKRVPRRRQPGFFGLITQFVRETIQDTNFLVRNVTDAINTEFPPSNSRQNSTSPSGARRLTLTEVNAILGRNYRSLVRLFNTEFRTAVADSRTNIQNYRQEFKSAVRPYFTEGAWSSTTTQRTSTQS